MDDLISRQAAIDALKNRWKKTRNYEGIGDDIAEECELYLKQVPSAQPEIIRCKDCEHRNTVDCPMCYLETIDWEEDGYVEVDYVLHDNTHDDGFCDRAERREE